MWKIKNNKLKLPCIIFTAYTFAFSLSLFFFNLASWQTKKMSSAVIKVLQHAHMFFQQDTINAVVTL